MPSHIDRYLDQLQEQKIGADVLPSDLLSFLMGSDVEKTIGRYRYRKPSGIDKNHRENLKYVSKESLPYVKRKKLFCFISYVNGDSAWYSFVDSKVYDYNHEIRLFNDQIGRDRADPRSLWQPMDYKDWLRLVTTKKKYDAWTNK